MGRDAQLQFGVIVQRELSGVMFGDCSWQNFLGRNFSWGKCPWEFPKGNVLSWWNVQRLFGLERCFFRREGGFRGRNVRQNCAGWNPHAGLPVSTCSDYDLWHPD